MKSGSAFVNQHLRCDYLPHIWCRGCGNGIILGSLLRAVHRASLDVRKVVVVSGIGCAGRISGYCNFDTLHTTHGRALAFATGVKLANPSLQVIVVMGDGDGLAIGGNHFIHAARRNVDLTAILINNWVYGMTGGQVSPTTPRGKITTTSPRGQNEATFDAARLAAVCGASYVARGTTYHVQQLDKLLVQGMCTTGFSLIEVISQCPTRFGRLNGFTSAVDMLKWQRDHAIPVGKARELLNSGKQVPGDAIITGVLDEPAVEYTGLQRGVVAAVKSG